MTPAPKEIPITPHTPPGACEGCRRRSWLLVELSAALEYRCRDRLRFLDLLTLGDHDLLEALGGSRREELRERYETFVTGAPAGAAGTDAVCVHDRSYPAALRDPGAPRMLCTTPGPRRFAELTSAPCVAIIGSTRASDYGVEMAKSLARGLAASGVTVISGLSEGIAVAAQAGALEGAGAGIAVMAGGLQVACPARRRSLYERVRQQGCAVSELPGDTRPRLWGQAASERTVARLAGLTVVVEAHDSSRELLGARIARGLGRAVAAVPGRVTSPASAGAHALLMEGASLVRGPVDALELLCGPGAPVAAGPAGVPTELEPRLREALEEVGAGKDTAEKLTREGRDAGELLLALSELELMGLLARGDGGRYVPRNAIPGGRCGR
jgi:DNA processing protein